MKKTIILLALLALSVSIYSVFEAYATISATPQTPTTMIPQAITPPTNPDLIHVQPNPHILGDPIVDPRPKAIHPPISM